jgi:hypothetical protein
VWAAALPATVPRDVVTSKITAPHVAPRKPSLKMASFTGVITNRLSPVVVAWSQADILFRSKTKTVPDLGISRPFDVKHNVHVQVDPTSATGFAVGGCGAVRCRNGPSQSCD